MLTSPLATSHVGQKISCLGISGDHYLSLLLQKKKSTASVLNIALIAVPRAPARGYKPGAISDVSRDTMCPMGI